MSRLTQENIMAGLVLLLLAGFLVISFQYGERARLVPVPVSTIGILLTLVQIYWQNTRPADELHIDLLEVLTKDQIKAADAPKVSTALPSVAAQLRGFAIVGALLLLFLALGPFPAIFIFMSAYLIMSRYSGIGLALLMAFSLTLVLWVLFVLILRIQVYWGLLEPLALSLGL